MGRTVGGVFGLGRNGKIRAGTSPGLVDEDTHAFNAILAAFGLPKKSEKEIALRKGSHPGCHPGCHPGAVQVMETALEGFAVAGAMVDTGNNSVTDAGVGVLALQACVEGAWMNVRINAADLRRRRGGGRNLARGKRSGIEPFRKNPSSPGWKASLG
ncbi:MAG: cyclodeaminase/cyclohydrolase family protein [Bacteroidales bacterium]